MRRRAIWQLFFVACVAGACFAPAAPAAELLVPSYFYPSGPGDGWSRMNTAAQQVSLTAILNPGSGPGVAVDPTYVNALSSLHASGGNIIGYVSTSYAARPIATVESDIDKYMSWYAVDGIFFDEMTADPNNAHYDYYATLYNYVKSRYPTRGYVVGNPGTNTQPTYLSRPTADTVVTFESNTGFGSWTAASWMRNYSPCRFSVIPYNVATSAAMISGIDRAVQNNVGAVYFTDDSGANPYDVLPSYWDAEVANVLDTIPRWNVNRSGDWTASTNWSGGIVPNGVGQQARLLNVPTTAATVFANGALTLGKLTFASPARYVLSGAGSLTMDVLVGSATISVTQGTHTINLPVTLNDNTTVNISSGATLRIADPLTLASGVTLNKVGPGTLSILSTVQTGSGASLAATGGGNVDLEASQTFASVTVSSGATIKLVGDSVLRADEVQTSSDARIDVADHAMIIGSATPTDRVAAMVKNGGIASSAAQPTIGRALGVVTSQQYRSVHGAGASFGGQTLGPLDTIVAYTWYGDTDLSGQVDESDYARLGTRDWFGGDFDGDGVVDVSDYALIDLGFNAQSDTLAAAVDWLETRNPMIDMNTTASLQMVERHFAQFGESYATAFRAAVPEPAAMGITCLLMALGYPRRTRR